MPNLLEASKPSTVGFTLVELMVVIPIALLLVGGIVGIMVSTAGDSISIRTKNDLTYKLQDAHDQIARDVETATAFLATTDTAFNITSPQGQDNNTQDFTNVGPNGHALLLHAPLTNRNPASSDRSIVFLANAPNPCSSDDINYNQPLLGAVAYFTKDNTLWRRTLMPPNYATAGCSVPWQRPSCQPGVSGSICITEDVKLLSGVDKDDFTVKYLSSLGSESSITIATSTSVASEVRQTALDGAMAVELSLTSRVNAGGEQVSEATVSRAVRRNN